MSSPFLKRSLKILQPYAFAIVIFLGNSICGFGQPDEIIYTHKRKTTKLNLKDPKAEDRRQLIVRKIESQIHWIFVPGINSMETIITSRHRDITSSEAHYRGAVDISIRGLILEGNIEERRLRALDISQRISAGLGKNHRVIYEEVNNEYNNQTDYHFVNGSLTAKKNHGLKATGTHVHVQPEKSSLSPSERAAEDFAKSTTKIHQYEMEARAAYDRSESRRAAAETQLRQAQELKEKAQLEQQQEEANKQKEEAEKKEKEAEENKRKAEDEKKRGDEAEKKAEQEREKSEGSRIMMNLICERPPEDGRDFMVVIAYILKVIRENPIARAESEKHDIGEFEKLLQAIKQGLLYNSENNLDLDERNPGDTSEEFYKELLEYFKKNSNGTTEPLNPSCGTPRIVSDFDKSFNLKESIYRSGKSVEKNFNKNGYLKAASRF